MRHLAILAPLLITLTAGTSLAIGELSRFNPRSTGLPIAGGTMKGPVAWCTITQAPDDTSPAIGVIGGCATDTGGNILETSTSHSGPITITRFDDALSGVNPFTGSTYEQLLWVFGVAASSQTTIQDGGDFRLKEIPWSSPASGDPSVILFKATYQTGSITAFADGTGGEVLVTSAAHGLQENQTVTIWGASDANYNGTFTATTVLTNTFKITTTWGSTDTGTWKSVLFDEAWRSGNVDDYFYQRIFVNDGNSTDFPYAQVVVSENDHGATDSRAFALIGEGLAIDGVRDGGGLLGAGETDGANNGVGMEGVASVAASADTGIAYGARGISIETHAGADNVGSHCNASGSSTANYCLELQAGDIHSIAAVNWLGLDNNASMVSWDAAGAADMLLISSLDGEETVAVTAKQTLTTALDASSGAEVAFDLSYTVNKTGGDDTGLRIRQTDTASPGTSLIVDVGVGASTQFFIDNTGLLALYGSSWTDALTLYHDETDAYFKTLDGKFIFQTDESTDTKTTMELKPKGTSETSELGLYDTDGQRLLLYTAADRAYIESQGGALGLQAAQVQDVKIWESIASGNPYLYLYGWDGGTSAVQYLRASVDATGDALLETDSGDLIVDTSTGDTRFSDENIKDVGDLQLDSITPDGTDISVAIGAGSLGIGDGAYSWDHTPNVGVEGILEVDGAAHLESTANVGGTLTAEGDLATTSAATWLTLDNTDDTLCIESTGDPGTLCIDSRDGADGVKMAGYLTVDGLLTAGGGMALGGDLDLQRNDLLNPANIHGEAPLTDAAPDGMVIHTEHSFVKGSQTASNLTLAGGIGDGYYWTITDRTEAGDDDEFVVTVNGTPTTFLSDTDFNCDGEASEADCACLFYDHIVANPVTGVSPDRADAGCSDARVYVQPDDSGTYSVVLTVVDGGGGTEAGAAANGTDGYILSPSDIEMVAGMEIREASGTVLDFASTNGVFRIRNIAKIWGAQLYASAADELTLRQIGGGDYATLKSGSYSSTWNYVSFASNYGVGFNQTSDNPDNDGAMFYLSTYTDAEMTADGNGEIQYGIRLDPELAMTNASSFVGIKHDPEITSQGTAQNYHQYMDWSRDSVAEFKLQDDGDIILHEDPGSDTPALDGKIFGANAYTQASAGAASNGANVHVAAGIRLLKLQCDDPTKTNIDTVVFTVNGVAQAALVESTDFDCFGFSADQCCINLAAAIVAAAYGITPDAVTLAGTTYLTPDEDLLTVDDIVIADGEADGVGISLVEGVDGSVVLHANYGAVRVTEYLGSTLVQLGGTTASYPALYQTSDNIQFILADTSAFADIYSNSFIGAANITAGASGYMALSGLTKWTSSGDGIWEMGINAGTRGVRMDTATLDGTLALYDEAGAALSLSFGGDLDVGGVVTHNETVTSDAKVTTTDALDNLIASITLADGEVLVVAVTILGRERDGTDRNMYHIKGLFYRQGAGAVQQGVSTYISEIESDIAWCGDLGVAGNDVQITVDGNGDTVDWEVTYTYQILVSAA